RYAPDAGFPVNLIPSHRCYVVGPRAGVSQHLNVSLNGVASVPFQRFRKAFILLLVEKSISTLHLDPVDRPPWVPNFNQLPSIRFVINSADDFERTISGRLSSVLAQVVAKFHHVRRANLIRLPVSEARKIPLIVSSDLVS